MTSQQPGPSPYSPQGSEEQIWRRPAGGGDGPPPISTPPSTPYAGPPRPVPPSPGWRPRTLIKVPPARTLPEQNDAALDEQDRAARTITYGVGMVAGAIALIVLIVLCGRALF